MAAAGRQRRKAAASTLGVTSTKKKGLPDTYYVDALVGSDTVNTMPTATLNAFREHGKPDPHALELDVVAARQTLDALDQLGIPSGNYRRTARRRREEVFERFRRAPGQRRHAATSPCSLKSVDRCSHISAKKSSSTR